MEERGSAYRGAMIGLRVEDQRITTPLYTLWSGHIVRLLTRPRTIFTFSMLCSLKLTMELFRLIDMLHCPQDRLISLS